MTRRRADPTAAAERDALALAMTADHRRDPFAPPARGPLATPTRPSLPTCTVCGSTGWTREPWPGKPDGWTCDRVLAWHPAPATVARALDRLATR